MPMPVPHDLNPDPKNGSELKGASRFALTLREARTLVAACEQYELGPDSLAEIWRSDNGALNAEGLLMRVQLTGANERFEVRDGD